MAKRSRRSTAAPSLTPRRLAAAKAALVRSLIAARSCSATAARMWTVSLLACGLSAAMNSTLLSISVAMKARFDVAVHQRGDEGEVAGEAVELGDDELSLVLAAGGQGLLQLGAIRTLAGLDLSELGVGSVLQGIRGGP
jgi:hypothetical protein